MAMFSFKFMIFIQIILLRNVLITAKECPYFSTVDNMVYFLPEEQVNVSVAERSCYMNGGRLANLQNEKSEGAIMNLLNKTVLADLDTMYAYLGVGKLNKDNYRYSTIPDLNDTNWKITEFNFTVYNQPFANYHSPLYFCFHNTTRTGLYKWNIHKSGCNNRWLKDGEWYEGEQDGLGVKKAYSGRNGKYSIKLSYEDFNDTIFNQTGDIFYFPDIRVYIGARSDVNQTDWFWSDGRMVNDSSYPNSSKDICQQISLHYQNNEWILSAQPCANRTAFYACEAQISAEIKFQHDNSTTNMNMSWNPLLFDKILSGSSNLSIKVENDSNSYTIGITNGSVMIYDFPENRNFSVQINVENEQCPSLNLSAIYKVMRDHTEPTTMTTAQVLFTTQSEEQTAMTTAQVLFTTQSEATTSYSVTDEMHTAAVTESSLAVVTSTPADMSTKNTFQTFPVTDEMHTAVTESSVAIVTTTPVDIYTKNTSQSFPITNEQTHAMLSTVETIATTTQPIHIHNLKINQLTNCTSNWMRSRFPNEEYSYHDKEISKTETLIQYKVWVNIKEFGVNKTINFEIDWKYFDDPEYDPYKYCQIPFIGQRTTDNLQHSFDLEV